MFFCAYLKNMDSTFHSEELLIQPKVKGFFIELRGGLTELIICIFAFFPCISVQPDGVNIDYNMI